MERGTLLHTKDGRKIGNAIIVEQASRESGPVFRIETDFGNKAVLTFDEIESVFFIGRVTDFDRWMRDRRTLSDGGEPELFAEDFAADESAGEIFASCD